MKNKYLTLYEDGKPCGHPGCLNHVTHPCECCGRVAGKNRQLIDDILKELHSVRKQHLNCTPAVYIDYLTYYELLGQLGYSAASDEIVNHKQIHGCPIYLVVDDHHGWKVYVS